MIKGFKEFLTRGNVVDLAVAVVIGAAFTAVINAFVQGFINPLVGLIFGQPDLNHITFTIADSTFGIGAILTALLNFVMVAAAVYFVIVLPLNKLAERRKRRLATGEETATEAPSDEVALLTEIRDLLRQGAQS